ncbi:MAG: AAA family ATPase, partial [Dolichospermum sp.]
MHIQKVIIKNFRCFEHLEVNLDPDINIFVGNNGSGKSALLDAIAAAMYPYVAGIQKIVNKEQEVSPVLQRDLPVKQNSSEQRNHPEFTLSTTSLPEWTIIYKDPPIENDVDDKKRRKSSMLLVSHTSRALQEGTKKLYSELLYNCDTLRYDKTSEFSVIAYYQSNRNLTNIADIENISNQSFDRFDTLKKAFNATANFTDLVNWFFVREYEELREGRNRKDINFELSVLKQVRNAISTIIAPNARVYFSGATSAKLMVEWTMETGEKRELLLSQLSAGYRNMLALVMD